MDAAVPKPFIRWLIKAAALANAANAEPTSVARSRRKQPSARLKLPTATGAMVGGGRGGTRRRGGIRGFAADSEGLLGPCVGTPPNAGGAALLGSSR